MAYNQKLSDSVSDKDLHEWGFIKKTDASGDARGITFELENSNFIVIIDAWYQIEIARKTSEGNTDSIIIACHSHHDLEQVVNFIA